MALGSRVRQLRQRLDLSQTELAQRIDVDPSYISHIENGRTKQPAMPIIQALAKALAVPVDDLLAAMAGKPTEPPPQRTPADILRELQASIEQQQQERQRIIMVPIVESLASAGEGAIAQGEIAYYPEAQEVGHQFRAIQVKGTCMEPEVRDGDVAVVDLDASPRFNDIVAITHDGEVLIRILRDGWLYSLNHHPPIPVDEHTKVEGVVVFSGRRPRVTF